MLFDAYYTVLLVPFPLTPAFGFCTTGLLRYGNLLWGCIIPFVSPHITSYTLPLDQIKIFLMEFLGICGLSVIMAAFYRLAAVYNVQYKINRWRVVLILALLQLLYPMPAVTIAITVGLQINDDEATYVEETLQSYPKLAPTLEKHLCVLASNQYPLMKLALGIGTALIAICVGVGFAMWTMSLIRLNKRKNLMSKRSYKLHRQ